MSESPEAREWQRIVRASVRECLEAWTLQAHAGPITVEALETILARAKVPTLRQLEERRPDLVVALLPSLVRTEWRSRWQGTDWSRGNVLRRPAPSGTRAEVRARLSVSRHRTS
jgi:hypothetical protein